MSVGTNETLYLEGEDGSEGKRIGSLNFPRSRVGLSQFIGDMKNVRSSLL